jgi:hypothetical protein
MGGSLQGDPVSTAAKQLFMVVQPIAHRRGVYFLECGNFIKIGISEDVHRRLKELRTMIPFDVDVLGFIPCAAYSEAKIVESALHIEFAKLRHRGEWFSDSEYLRVAIQERAAAWPT